MEKDYVFTQTKEITMTSDKIVTVITEKLETIDAFGKKTICGYANSKRVKLNDNFNSRRAA